MEMPESQIAFDYEVLARLLEEANDTQELRQAIVNTPFYDKATAAFLFLGIVVLLIVNDKDGVIERVALSNTMHADGTKQMSVKRFEDIRIPLEDKDNIIAKAIRSGDPQATTDWAVLFTPELTPEQARMNQAGGGIGYSEVYPLSAGGTRGAMIFSYYQYPEGIVEAQKGFMRRYVAMVENRLSR